MTTRTPIARSGRRALALLLVAGCTMAGCSNKVTEEHIDPMVEEPQALEVEPAPTPVDPYIGRTYRVDDAGNKVYVD